MAVGDITEVNGVTKTELQNGVFEYLFPYARILADNVNSNNITFYIVSVQKYRFYSQLLANISLNYGATTAEEYCDQLAERELFFSPVSDQSAEIVNAIQFADEGFGERYMQEVQDYQATSVNYYGIMVIRLKDGETRNVHIQHVAMENQNPDDYQVLIFEYDRGQIPSVMNNASIAYQDIGESCEESVVTQTGGPNNSGIIVTQGIKKDGLWISRNRRSGDWSPRVLMNPNKEYLIAIETVTTGSDIFGSTTILEKPQ